MSKKEIIEPITEHWQRECLESIFGDEEIHNVRWNEEMDKEYELEVVLRRVGKRK